MVNTHNQKATILNKSNTRIIIYFLAFAFLPLLLFSIFGYLLNKNLLTGINIAQLQSLNQSSAKQIETYLHYKQHIIKHAFADYQKSGERGTLADHLYRYNLNDSDFYRIDVIDNKYSAQFQSGLTSDGHTIHLIPVLYRVNEFSIIGYLRVEKLMAFFKNDLKKMQNIFL